MKVTHLSRPYSCIVFPSVSRPFFHTAHEPSQGYPALDKVKNQYLEYIKVPGLNSEETREFSGTRFAVKVTP